MRLEDKPPDSGTLAVLACQNIVYFIWAVMFRQNEWGSSAEEPHCYNLRKQRFAK